MINKGGSLLWIRGYFSINTNNYIVDKRVDNYWIQLCMIVNEW